MAKREKGKDGYFRAKIKYKGETIDVRSQSEKELEEKIRQKKNEIDSGVSVRGKDATFKERGDAWLELKKPDITYPVYKAYKTTLEKYAYPDIGDMKISQVTKSDILGIISGQAEQSAWTRARIGMVMSTVFALAVEDKIITSNPVSSVKVKLPSGSNVRSLTDDEVKLLMSVCEHNPYGLWIEMLYYTGIRQQESVPLTWGRINKKTKTVRIYEALKATGKIGDPKNAYSFREVVIPDDFYNKLMAREGKPDELIFPTEHIKNTNRGGKKMTRKAMARRWKSILRDMDILSGRKTERNKLVGDSMLAPDLTLLCLRHTYATNLCRAGIDVKTAISLMGHSDADMIMKIYSDYTKDQERKAQEKLSAFFSPENEESGSKGGSDNK